MAATSTKHAFSSAESLLDTTKIVPSAAVRLKPALSTLPNTKKAPNAEGGVAAPGNRSASMSLRDAHDVMEEQMRKRFQLEDDRKVPAREESNLQQQEWIEEARLQLFKALRTLPIGAACAEALQKAYAVVQKESNPVKFLQLEGWSVQGAALRLAKYWQERKAAFGERAFKPLSASLTSEDVEAYESEFLVSLPRPQGGQPVLFWDLTRMKPALIENNRLVKRVFFVLMEELMAAADQATTSFHCLVLIRTSKMDVADMQSIFQMLQTSFAAQMKTLHVCCLPPKECRKYFSRIQAPLFQEKFSSVLQSVFVHVGKAPPDLLEHLGGFQPDLLPLELGGTLDVSEMVDKLAKKLVAQETSEVTKPTPQEQQSSDAKEAQDGWNSEDDEEDLSKLSPKERMEVRRRRKRAHDAAYSKKRRMRERGEQARLERDHVEVMEVNENLWAENHRLEGLLAQAQRIVASHTAAYTTVNNSAAFAAAVASRPVRPPAPARSPRVDLVLKALAMQRRANNCSVRELLTKPRVNDYILGVLDSSGRSTAQPQRQGVDPYDSLSSSQGFPGVGLRASGGVARHQHDEGAFFSAASRNLHSSSVSTTNMGQSTPAFPSSAASGALLEAQWRGGAHNSHPLVGGDMAAMNPVLPASRGGIPPGIESMSKSSLHHGGGRLGNVAGMEPPPGERNLVNTLEASLMQSLQEADMKTRLLHSLRRETEGRVGLDDAGRSLLLREQGAEAIGDILGPLGRTSTVGVPQAAGPPPQSALHDHLVAARLYQSEPERLAASVRGWGAQSTINAQERTSNARGALVSKIVENLMRSPRPPQMADWRR